MKYGMRWSLVLALFMVLALPACKSPVARQKAPDVPQDLGIESASIGDTLSWSSVSGADSYNVYFSEDDIAYSEYASTSGTSYLLPFYGYYKVSAENEAGESSLSAGIERAEPAGFWVETPYFTPGEGNFDVAQSVSISCATGGATIYYTLDGSTPQIGVSPEYTVPIPVASGDTFHVVAIAALAGYSNSDAAAGTFHVRSWETVGSAGFSAGEVWYVSLALDDDGTPYVAYTDASTTPQYKATVMRYSGASWSALGGTGISADAAIWTSVATDSAGSVYIAYKDSSVNKATVRRYGGSSWSTVGSAGFSAGSVTYTSMDVHSAGAVHTPYLAYQDSGNGNKATVLRYDGTSWLAVGSAGFSANAVLRTSLALTDSGTPYLAYIDSSTNKATVMVHDGGWSAVGGEGISSGLADYVSLALDGDGTPYIAYQDDSTSPADKATVMRYSGSSWEAVGAAGFSSGTAEYVSLAIRDDGVPTPYVAYIDGSASDKVTVMKYSGGTWSVLGEEGVSAGAADYLDMELDAEGNVFVAFKDSSTAPAGKATVLAFR